MAPKSSSTYKAKAVDPQGYAIYSADENQVWHELMTRQLPLVRGRACEEYIQGIELLNLTCDKIPQCPDVSKVLKDMTGWTLEPVPALISFNRFFQLLANRKFPAAT